MNSGSSKNSPHSPPPRLIVSMIPCLEPPLRWPGGKRWLVPILAELYAPYPHLCLVDPFCGGLAVALGLRPLRARLSDLNPGLIVFYQWLQRGLVIDPPPIVDKTSFLVARARYNQILGDPAHSREQACLFYGLNRTCYRGTSRTNDKGKLNCTYGNSPNRLLETDFRAFAPLLEPWEFVCSDANDIEFDAQDFVYADPPHDGQVDVVAPRSYRWDDQVRLAEQLAKHKGPVVISNSGTARVVDLYRQLGFYLFRIEGGPAKAPNIEIPATRNL